MGYALFANRKLYYVSMVNEIQMQLDSIAQQKQNLLNFNASIADGHVTLDEALADPSIPAWRKAELRVLKQYGGEEQLSYLAGEKVPHSTPGATRPDLVRKVGDHIEAIEVKYYDLDSPGCRSTLYRELEREVAARMTDLPPNSTQRVVLDVTGRHFSNETITMVKETIQSKLLNIYGSNIPVDIVGL